MINVMMTDSGKIEEEVAMMAERMQNMEEEMQELNEYTSGFKTE